MNESVVIGKDVDAKKGFSSAHRNDKSIQLVRDESERQLDSLGGVIGNIRRNGAAPSAESIATELGGRSAAQRAPALLALQQTHGNRYVQRVVAGIQAKLKIGQPGDIYEQEADRVADQVMRMAEPEVQRQVDPEEEEELIQTKPLAEEITPLVQRQVEPEEEEEEEIQTKQLPKPCPEMVPDVETRISSIRGGGRPLPGSIQAFFEPRFGYDFSQVRVHTDAEAADTARAVNARAFTRGHDVVFGAGQYAPGASEGRRLMAHELTHVVQQDSAGKHIQKQGFKSSISFRTRLFSRWFKLPAAQSLKAIIDTKRVPKGCVMPSKYDVYLFNHSTKGYETTVSYEIDKRQSFIWKGLTSGTYQFILRTSGNIAKGCKLEGDIEVKHESAIKQIIPVGKSHVGSSTWAYSANKPPYGPKTDKCNLFVYDVLNEAGASVQMKTRDRGWLKGLITARYVKHPPLAGQWANSSVSIPGWMVVKTPQVGDVAAEAIQYLNATGHVGIVSEVTQGGKNGKTISATATKVVENDWGFRAGQNVVFRRYMGK